MTIRDIILQKRENAARFEPTRTISQARMVSMSGSVEVPGRAGFVWVQERNQTGGVFQIFNPGIVPTDNLPVLIESAPRPPYQRRISDVDWSYIIYHGDYDPTVHYYMVRHAPTHEWPDGAIGSDPVTVYPRALSMLRAYAGSAGLTVSVAPYRYENNGDAILFPGHADLDLSGSQPAVGLARYVLVYLDTETNTILTSDGDTVVDAPVNIPTPPDPPLHSIPSAWVRLDGAATEFAEADFVDARILLGEVTGQMATVLASMAHAEEELDYVLSRHIVEHNPNLVNELALLEAEYDYDQTRHVVQG